MHQFVVANKSPCKMQDGKMLSSEGFFGNRAINTSYSQLFVYKNQCFIYLQELEQIEEHYKQETRDLLSTAISIFGSFVTKNSLKFGL